MRAVSGVGARLIGQYANRYCAIAHNTGQHSISSPLLSWLWLALVADGAGGRARVELEESLGCTADDARALACDLLALGHPGARFGIACWTNQFGSPHVDAWLSRLPMACTVGDIPTQSDIDLWAAQTAGTIRRYPVAIDQANFVLGAVLTARPGLRVPFAAMPSSRLGGTWAARCSEALISPEIGGGHTVFVASTIAGRVGVHVCYTKEHLAIISVIANPEVDPADVLCAAHDVASLVCGSPESAVRISAYDLQLGRSPNWDLDEYHTQTNNPAGKEERGIAVLPRWEATGDLDQIRMGLPGGEALVAAFQELSGHDAGVRITQRTSASFDRNEYDGAPLTSPGPQLPMVNGVVRRLEIVFGRPYAVVAVALDRSFDDTTRQVEHGPWHGVPLWSAWISEPMR